MPTDSAALRRLHAEATPDDGCIVRDRYQYGGGRMSRVNGVDRQLILDVYDEGNREFYFSVHSSLPALLDELDLLREVAAAAGEYLRRGRCGHERDCGYWRREATCSCGLAAAGDRLDAALARLREKQEKP